jgi:hypothetical protein
LLYPTFLKPSLLDLIRRSGLVRAKGAVNEGFAAVQLSRLVEKGKLVRVSRGLYELTEVENLTEHHTLAEASRAVPSGIVPRATWISLPSVPHTGGAG